MAKVYEEYSKRLGKWYGRNKGGVWEATTNPNKRNRTYTRNNSIHGGYVFVSDRYKDAFPKGFVEKSKGGNYHIAMRFSKEQIKYQPFSPLNAQKSGERVIDGRYFSKHIFTVRERLSINSQNFAVILSIRAEKIFQNSFKYKKFYSADGSRWQDLNIKTIKKRIRKKTWPGAGGMLAEYGDMYHSIVTTPINDNMGITTGMRVFTDPSEYKRPLRITGRSVKRKIYKRSIPVLRRDRRAPFCYAGLHNYGGRIRGGHRLPKRQFIGHSSYLFDFAKKEINKYLFYDVFD